MVIIYLKIVLRWRIIILFCIFMFLLIFIDYLLSHFSIFSLRYLIICYISHSYIYWYLSFIFVVVPWNLSSFSSCFSSSSFLDLCSNILHYLWCLCIYTFVYLPFINLFFLSLNIIYFSWILFLHFSGYCNNRFKKIRFLIIYTTFLVTFFIKYFFIPVFNFLSHIYLIYFFDNCYFINRNVLLELKFVAEMKHDNARPHDGDFQFFFRILFFLLNIKLWQGKKSNKFYVEWLSSTYLLYFSPLISTTWDLLLQSQERRKSYLGICNILS